MYNITLKETLEKLYHVLNLESYTGGLDLLNEDAEILITLINYYFFLITHNGQENNVMIQRYKYLKDLSIGNIIEQIKNNLYEYVEMLHDIYINKTEKQKKFISKYGNKLIKIYNKLTKLKMKTRRKSTRKSRRNI